MIKPLKAAFGLLTKVVNIKTKDNFMVSTIQNPSGVYETAVFKVPNLFILSILANFIKPTFLVNSGNYEDASLKHIQICQLFEQLNPRELIRKYKENGEIDNSKLLSKEEYAMQGDRIDPNDAKAYFNQGLTYAMQGNFNQAISYFTRAIDIDPRYASAYQYRGLENAIKGNLDQAISDFTQVISIDPRYAAAYNERGIAYVKKGNPDQAISDFTQEISIDPRDARAYFNRGLIYAIKSNYDQAISDFTQAINNEPRDGKIYEERGRTYYRQGDFNKAWQDIHKAQELGHDIEPEFLAELKIALGRDSAIITDRVKTTERNIMKTICVKCKKCGKITYITEKHEGQFNNPITFVCTRCNSVYSNIKIEEIFDHNMGEMPRSSTGFKLGQWALIILVSGVVWCFINLKVGLISIGVAILLYFVGMVIGYRSMNK